MKLIPNLMLTTIQIALVIIAITASGGNHYIICGLTGILLLLLNHRIMDYGNTRKLTCPVCGKEMK